MLLLIFLSFLFFKKQSSHPILFTPCCLAGIAQTGVRVVVVGTAQTWGAQSDMDPEASAC